MQIYVVGGAVRDTLLGKKVQDHDYVVVGATPAQLISLGFQPVGKDFPVFLHPITKEEYALARTERKTARGYRGFNFYYAPDVTLEQDLIRRDLTMNAMACAVHSNVESVKKSLENASISAPAIHRSNVIDPFGGLADIQMGVLRHVSDAFAEDPVRILRAARFAARFPDFHLAPETLSLMRQMVQAGEVDALVAERVWQEIASGLMSTAPERLFITLHACGALDRLMPELNGLFANTQDASEALTPPLLALRYAAQQNYALSVRFAIVVTAQANTAPFLSLCKRLKVPNTCRDLALLIHREGIELRRTLKQDPTLQADDIVALLERCDAFRRPEYVYGALQVCEAHQVACNTLASHLMPTAAAHSPEASTLLLLRALRAAQEVDAGAIAAHYPKQPEKIKQAVHNGRVGAVQCALQISPCMY